MKNNLEEILFASARASVRFARTCLEPVKHALRSRSTFVDPRGKIMHWHDFGDLEGPGWAANAVGGAVLLYRWGSFLGEKSIQAEAAALVDHILEDGFIRPDGFIWPYFELARNQFCLNYTHNNDWLCPGSLARIGSQMLEFASLLPASDRAYRIRLAAAGLGKWLKAHTPLLPDGWVPRRITLEGQPYPHSPTGGKDPIYKHSADGIFLLSLYAGLVREGDDSFRDGALALGETFVSAGGYWGSINHDTYDDHESVAYACAYRILQEAGDILEQPHWHTFATEVALPALDRFRMAEDRHGVSTRGLLWMEETWDTAYLWENAEAAHASLEAWARGGSQQQLQFALDTLRAIANHHYGPLGFLTEGVDWNNHVSRRHHIEERLFGAIKYTEPLLNNLHLVGPTLFYFERTGYKPAQELDDQASIGLVNRLSAETAPPKAGENGAQYYLRLYYPALETDERVEQALAFVQEAGVDGVLLFEASYDMDPAILTMDALEGRFNRLCDVAPRFRSIGLEIHINMMITLGHVDAGCAHPERFPFQFIVNTEGTISRSTACPLDPLFLEHVRAQYRLAAQCHPSAIWVDDDTRYLWHDIPGLACFCPHHLEKMRQSTGIEWTPAELASAMADDLSLRQVWLDVQEESIMALARVIETSVHDVDPNIRIGLMTVGAAVHTAEGRRSDRLLRALAGVTRPMIRPGSGYWNDWNPASVIEKTEDCARQINFVGADVQAFAEVENHPYTAFGKSERLLLLELALNVLAGMPDLSLNILTSMGGSGPLQPEETDYARFLARHRPFLDSLAKAWSGRSRRGIGVASLETTPRYAMVEQGKNNLLGALLETRPWELLLARIGMPVGSPGKAPHWIAGETARAMSGYELDQCLREGAVLDPAAAQVLIDRGKAAPFGLQAARRVGEGVNEKLTDSTVYGSRSGHILPIYNHISCDDLYTYEIDGSQAKILSRWIDVDGQDRGPAATLLESANGLRAALLPYHLHATAPVLLNPAHRNQWSRMLEWVWGKPLPFQVVKGVNLYPLCFQREEDDSWLVAVANLSADDAIDASLEAGFQPRKIEYLNPDGTWQEESAFSVSVPGFSLRVWRLFS